MFNLNLNIFKILKKLVPTSEKKDGPSSSLIAYMEVQLYKLILSIGISIYIPKRLGWNQVFK